LYTGITNDLQTRMLQHFENRGKWRTFAGRYNCYRLIYYEHHENVEQAIEREKEVKNLSRKKKGAFISVQNPEWHFYDLRVWSEYFV